MKKVIAMLIVLALVIGAGAYYFFFREVHDTPTCGEGFRLDFSTRTCVPVTDGPNGETRDVDFTQVQITVPDSNIKLKLTQESGTSKYSATFSSEDDSSMEGFLSIDAAKTTRVSDQLVLAPMFVTYGGTGQFLNMALFNSQDNTYLGSVFIGDRVGTGDVVVQGQIVKVNYKTRLGSEGYAAEPTIPAQVVLEVRDNSIKEIMRLQNADYSEVELKSPTPNSNLSGEFVVRGSVPGSWYFEANAQFKIIDEMYQELAIGSVQALSDWMTTQRVPFELKLNTSSLNGKGKVRIIISSENVQGDEDGERKVKMMEIPVVIR